MSSTVKLALAALALTALALTACTAAQNETPDAAGPGPDAAMQQPCTPVAGAPTYTKLYNTYFAKGTPGHCANDNCHGTSGFAVWSCGTSKDSCFTGMVGAGIINKSNPSASRIISTSDSPLRWFNPRGAMPADAQTANNTARDAVAAWVASCALNN